MKLLLVEDEEMVARMLARSLADEGHDVDACSTGGDALRQGLAVEYDAVILDRVLPDADGISVLREWRWRGMRSPVLMVSGLATTDEKVAGLRAGADDYLEKPFEFQELLARVEVLRRRRAAERPDAVGDVTIDRRQQALHVHGREESLTPRELALFSELAEHRGETLSRKRLLHAVWGPSIGADSNAVDVHVGHLREKLERLRSADVSIETVRGVGFKLVVRGEHR